MERHGTIIAGRFKGTRGALVTTVVEGQIIRPFNDTAETEDARIHLSPLMPILVPFGFFELDEEE